MTNSLGIEPNPTIDVAIVGGGISGAYTGWRLIKSENFEKVCLFELSDRIGGRLFSVQMPGMQHVYAEFGGMYFCEAQAIVWELVKKFQLQAVRATLENPNNLLYVRNQHLRVKDLADAEKVPYNLRFNERGKDSGTLYSDAVKRVIPNNGDLPPEYFSSDTWNHVRETLKVDGQSLYNMSIWEVLLKVLSQEAYTLCLDEGNFYSDLGTWNAAQAIATNMSIPYDQDWFMIQNGYQRLPEALVAEFKRDGGDVCLSHRLAEFKRDSSSNLIELTFVDPMGNPYPPVWAKHLVLAMPKRALELLCEDNKHNFLFQHAEFLKNLQTVTGDPAYKLFHAYDYPWWRSLGLSGGHSTTDLPIRQCYYFGTEGEQPGANPSNLRSLLLANFPDGHAASFWRSMEYNPQKPERHPPFENAISEEPPTISLLKSDRSRTSQPLLASRKMVSTAQTQLKELHGLDYIPQPYCAFYLDWTKDPYGGGWHSWNPHCKPWKIMKQIRHPFPDANVYICGEAYSNKQGWVQGALNSAELMLEENFGLNRPEWLPPSYDLGS